MVNQHKLALFTSTQVSHMAKLNSFISPFISCITVKRGSLVVQYALVLAIRQQSHVQF